MTEFHCPHDGAVLTPAIELCPTCGDEFTGPHGTAIKQRIEQDTVARIVQWLRDDPNGNIANLRLFALTDAIERGAWRKKP